MNLGKIKDVKSLKLLESSTFLELENFEAIKYRACDYIDGLDWDYAVEFSKVLEDRLRQVLPRTSQERKFLRVLWFWVVKLRLFAFNSLSSQDRSDFIKHYLLHALSEGLDVKTYINDALAVYGSEKAIQEDVDGLLFALHNSDENIGTSEEFGSRNFKPTVENWLREYQAVMRGGAQVEAGAFHIVKFLDSNQFVKLLNLQEREVLKELLDMYNWLLNPFMYARTNEEESKIMRVNKGVLGNNYINKQTFTVPEQLQRQQVAPRPAPAPKVPPAVPQPKIPPVKKVGMDEIMSGKEQKPAVSEPKVDLSSSAFRPGVKLGDAAGMKFSSSTTVTAENLAARMERDRQQTAGSKQPVDVVRTPSKAEGFVQKEIERKLQTLEERVNKKQN